MATLAWPLSLVAEDSMAPTTLAAHNLEQLREHLQRLQAYSAGRVQGGPQSGTTGMVSVTSVLAGPAAAVTQPALRTSLFSGTNLDQHLLFQGGLNDLTGHAPAARNMDAATQLLLSGAPVNSNGTLNSSGWACTPHALLSSGSQDYDSEPDCSCLVDVSPTHPPLSTPALVPGMTASLYIKNLPPEANELFLYRRFSPFGALLSCKVHVDHSGKCRGVGFVNFAEQAGALRALTALNGTRTSAGQKLLITLQAPRAVRVAFPPQAL